MSAGAMYPGTFDPITNGHVELVRRSAKIFDRVVIAVAESPAKQPLFDFNERIELARTVVADLANVTVEGYDGLTVEFASQHELGAIVRGLRAVSDFEYEFQLASMNRHLAVNIETVFLTPTDDYAFVSSSLVREVAGLGGDIDKFVPPQVASALKAKFPGR